MSLPSCLLDTLVFQVLRYPVHRLHVPSFVQGEHCCAYKRLYLYVEQRSCSDHQIMHFTFFLVLHLFEPLQNGDIRLQVKLSKVAQNCEQSRHNCSVGWGVLCCCPWNSRREAHCPLPNCQVVLTPRACCSLHHTSGNCHLQITRFNQAHAEINRGIMSNT